MITSKRYFCSMLVLSLILLLGMFWQIKYFQTLSRCLISSANSNAEDSKKAYSTTIEADDDIVTLNDLHITLKTTKKNHATRLVLLWKTWIGKAISQTYVVTDEEDEIFQEETDINLIPTNCGNSHGLEDLCCKTSVEFDMFLNRTQKWWCHFDDDNYVNLNSLVELLNQFNWNESVYIGRKTWPDGIESKYKGVPQTYDFGTGGAGICITRTLAKRMKPWISNKALVKMCRDVDAEDDCTVGFIINHILKVPLYESLSLHSHLEVLDETINTKNLKSQVSFSYGNNRVTPFGNSYKAAFNETVDPSRFLSIHCLLYPDEQMCLHT